MRISARTAARAFIIAALAGAVALAITGFRLPLSDFQRVGSAFGGVVESRAFLSTAFVFAWSGAFIAALGGALMLTRWPGRRDALAPIVGGVMLAAGFIDAFHALSFVWWFDVVNPTPRSEDALWYASRVLFAGGLTLAGAVAVWNRRTQRSRLLLGGGAVALLSLTALVAVALDPAGGAGAAVTGVRWVAIALIIAALIVAGALLRKSARRVGGWLPQALAWSVMPHIAAEIAFALGHARGYSAALTAAAGLRMLAYLTPTLAVAWETARAGRRALSMERRLEAATRCANDGVWDWPDVECEKQRWSSRFYELLGYAANDLPASRETLLSLIAPEHVDEVREALKGIASDASTFTLNVRMRRRSGKLRWFCIRGEALRDEAADRLSAVGAITDIDAEMMVKDELAFQKRALDEHAIVAITDARGTITYANDKFCEISKYCRDELIGQNHRIVNSGYHSKQFFKNMYATIARGGTWRGEICNRAKDGSIYWVDTTIVPMQDAGGAIRGYVAIRADITARKRAEETVRSSEERLRRIVESTSDGAWDWNLNDDSVHYSERWLETLGYTSEESGDRLSFLESLLHPDDSVRMREALHKLVNGDIARLECEIRLRTRSGAWLPRLCRGVVVERGEAASPRRIVCVDFDISPLKRAERDLEQKNEQLEQFVYTVSHDLKTPIVTLKGYTGWMEEELREGRTAELDRCAQRIRDAANRMETLVQDLLELSRAGKTVDVRGPVDLGALARQVVAEHAVAAEERHVRIEIEGNPPTIQGDDKRLRDVLDNLVGNAIKYGANESGGAVRIGACAADDELRVYVADDGPGIDPQYQSKIFNIFERLANDDEGTGVGLAIVRRVMEAHGGRAWVESEAGAGATFWIAFPHHVATDPHVADRKPPARVAA